MLKKIGTYFLRGVLFTVPLAVTLYVIFALLGFIDAILPTILPFKIDIPGLGLVILVVMITVIGFLGNTVVAKPINFFFRSFGYWDFVTFKMIPFIAFITANK
jgi:uncharacterized membrane protein